MNLKLDNLSPSSQTTLNELRFVIYHKYVGKALRMVDRIEVPIWDATRDTVYLPMLQAINYPRWWKSDE